MAIRLMLLLALLTGCATFTKPTNELRVSSFSGNVEPAAIGSPVEGQVQVDGCRVVQEGVIEGCLTVFKAGCTYTSPGCADQLTPESMR